MFVRCFTRELSSVICGKCDTHSLGVSITNWLSHSLSGSNVRAQKFEHFTANLQVVGSNPAYTCVCGNITQVALASHMTSAEAKQLKSLSHFRSLAHTDQCQIHLLSMPSSIYFQSQNGRHRLKFVSIQ